MKYETRQLIKTFSASLKGNPWYGKAVYKILNDADEKATHLRIVDHSHSVLELLYHMISWSGFVLSILENDIKKAKKYESLNWRKLNSTHHSWKKGIAEFKKINQSITKNLLSRDTDDYLKAPVPLRKYNHKFLLEGLVQHNIYHAGQIAFIIKTIQEK